MTDPVINQIADLIEGRDLAVSKLQERGISALLTSKEDLNQIVRTTKQIEKLLINEILRGESCQDVQEET